MGSKIVVLGGSGAMAQVTVRDLIDSPVVDLVGIADINYEGAKSLADQLATDKVSALRADVRDSHGLRRLIGEFDVVVNSTWYQFNLDVMRAAIAAGVHYMDLGGLYHMTMKQMELDREAKNSSVTCILGIGSSPGTMNLMAAYGASKMSKIKSIKLRSGSSPPSKPTEILQAPYSIRTILDEFTLPPMILREGKIQEASPLSGKERFSLPAPVGELEGYYTLHSELATLPRTLNKGVQEMDFIVAFPPEFTKTVALFVKMGLASRNPIVIKGTEVIPYDVLVAVIDSLPKVDAELDVDVERTEVYGESDSTPLKLKYDSISVPNERWKIGGGIVSTGVPPSIAAQWLAQRKITVRGVVPPESCIEPLGFFKELSQRHIRTYEYSEDSRKSKALF